MFKKTTPASCESETPVPLLCCYACAMDVQRLFLCKPLPFELRNAAALVSGGAGRKVLSRSSQPSTLNLSTLNQLLVRLGTGWYTLWYTLGVQKTQCSCGL